MDDPVYESGVTAKSVVMMVSDISSALAGNASYISAPVPLEGRVPTSHVLFAVSPDVPTALSPGFCEGRSRRTYNHGLRSEGHTSDSRACDPKSSDPIIQSLDNAILDLSASQDDEVQPAPSRSEDIENKQTQEPPVNHDVVKSRRRRIACKA